MLLHGFPELGFSWRHQVGPLAAAGYRVLVPDMRGFGDSDAPDDAEQYAVDVLAGDVLGLLDHAGAQRGTVIGHDWGADVAWKTAWLHPERVLAVAGLSVPFAPRAPAPPLGLMRKHLGEDFYMVWFQQPGVAEQALARDVRRTLATLTRVGRGVGGRHRRSAADAAVHDRRRARRLRADLRSHGLSRRAQLLPQPRPQLGADGSTSPSGRSPRRRCFSPASATRCGGSCRPR